MLMSDYGSTLALRTLKQLQNQILANPFSDIAQFANLN